MSEIIQQLHHLYQQNMQEIEHWFAEHYTNVSAPFYSSVDVRNSGYKIAPVDANLFPAGFNNLSNDSIHYASDITKEMLVTRAPHAKKALILPENHTRNQGYIDNLSIIATILKNAGLEVEIGQLSDHCFAEDAADNTTNGAANYHDTDNVYMLTSGGQELISQPIYRKNDRIITASGFTPDMIIVNNDLTSGAPNILCGIEQQVCPPIGMGWYQRKKSVYFEAYNKVSTNFSETFGIDNWLINALFAQCGSVNFKDKTGIECVALHVEKVLHKLREKYKEFNIQEDPYVFVKADSGTYGMGIMTARSGEDIYSINKKARNKMNIIKEKTQNTEVIIQEGVPTVDLYQGEIAEPFIYMIDKKAIGGAWRINNARDKYNNLNASGMSFTPIADDFRLQDKGLENNAFCLIAELATLATAYEKNTMPTPCNEEAAI